jgi:DIS3-like exonuclease 2
MEFKEQKDMKKKTNGKSNPKKKNNNKEKEGQKEKRVFEDHLPLDEINEGLKNYTLFQGKLKVFANKRKLGYVEVEGLKYDVLIEDEKLRNRALVGDTVVVSIFPEDKWIKNNNLDKNTEEDDKKDENVENVVTSLEKMELDNRTTRLWRPREDLLREFHQEKVKEDDNENMDSEEARAWNGINLPASINQTQPTGKIVGIVSRAPKGHTAIAGALTVKTPPAVGCRLADNVSYCTFKPANAAYPHFIVPRLNLPDAFREDPNAFSNHIFLLDAAPLWPASSNFPFGENVRTMGEVGTIQAETTALLVENDLNHSIFSDEILESLNDMLRESSGSCIDSKNENENVDGQKEGDNWVIPEEEIKQRLDLRSTRIFTIDPPGAKDLDDALHITPLPASSPPCCSYEVGVHIADVSHFVREGTALDKEALNRATSVYLVQKVIPMLPSLLCEQLCSLNPNVDRLAFSCIFNMTDDGCLCPNHEPFFGKTVIRSCAKLDYGTAQRMVDGEIPATPSVSKDGNEDSHIDELPEEIWERRRRPPNGSGQKAWEVARDVQLLHKVAMPRRAQRLNYGALSLNNPKITFKLDAEGNPCTTSTYEIKESNQLIEEYMLLANYLVAEKLVETVGRFGFLRCHPQPKASGMQNLVDLASSIGYDIDITSAYTLQQSLKGISTTASPDVTHAITTLMMLPMTCAEYIINYQKPSDNWKQYALANPYYTQFNSPISRYADVMVHRFLLEGLKLEKEMKEAPSEEVAQDLKISSLKGLQQRYSFAKLHQIADQCNDRKKSAHAAQLRSDEVYLGVYLMNHPQQIKEAVVIGVGEKSFSVLVLEYSVQSRIFLDKTEELSLPESTYHSGTQTLTLHHKKTGMQVEVTYMSRVLVRVYASTSPPPISVNVALSEATFTHLS